MGELILKGALNLMGSLVLKDKVKVGDVEALVVGGECKAAPPVLLPPPPASPTNPGPGVKILSSFNTTVTAGGKPIVAQGIVMQDNAWPGMMLPSTGNTGPVTADGFVINVKGDQAVIFPSGGSASFDTSGQ